MLNSKSVQLVTVLRCAAFCSLFFIFSACSGGDAKKDAPEEQQAKTGAPPAAATDIPAATPLQGAEAEVKSLLYRVKAGDIFRYKYTQNDRINQDGMMAETQQTLFYTKTVKSIKSDGTIEMTVRYDSIRLKNDYPDLQDSTKRTVSAYNSSNKADRGNQEFNQYNGILGEDVTILVSSDGKIREISGLTPLLSKIFGKMKDSLNAQQQEQALDQIRTQLYMRPLSQEYQSFPDGGIVDSTHTWSHSEKSPLSGVFLVSNTITYNLSAVKNVGPRKAAFVSAKLISKIENTAPKQGTLSFTLHQSDISGSGETIIDVEKGYTILKKNSISTLIDATMTDTKSKQSKRAKQQLLSSMKVELIR